VDTPEYCAYKVRLYPNTEQETLFRKTAGCCRFVYNYFLNERIKYYEKTGKSRPSFDSIKRLTVIKKWERYEWLQEVDSQSLQQSIRHLDTSYSGFFRRIREGKTPGFPRFKAKHKVTDSFTTTQHNWVCLPTKTLKIGKLGYIKFKGLSSKFPMDRKIQSITVSQDSNKKWYASILVKQDTQIVDYKHPFDACGIDIGVVQPLTVAYGTASKVLGRSFSKALEVKETRRKRYQRQLSRKVLRSSNWEKAKRKVGTAFYREKMVRKDWIEKTSTAIVKRFKNIAVEDLGLANMTRSAKGTKEAPGTNVKAKSGLNRSLLRLGLSTFLTRLEQKAVKWGSIVHRVDPRFTSQTCNSCGVIDKASRESQSRFHCVACGHLVNADVNAARNILQLIPG